MNTQILTKQGKEAGKIALPEEVFGLPWNADLVHQVVVSLQANKRAPLAHAKGRHEKRGGGAKPWRQKGTGRARHGSIRSPLWSGGGVTHGPLKEKNYHKKINRRAARKALYVVLSQKYRDSEVIFVDDISISEPKTKEAHSILHSLAQDESRTELAKKRGNRALILVPEKNEAVEKSFRNIASVDIEEIRNVNALLALSYAYILIVNPEEALKVFESST